MLHHFLNSLEMTGIMAWQILWALCLGFLLSSIIEAVVSKAQLSRLLPDSSPRTIVKASALGAASSCCAPRFARASSKPPAHKPIAAWPGAWRATPRWT